MNERRRWNLNIHYHRVVFDAIPEDATTALDVGSGDGLLAFDLAAKGLEVVGIDTDIASVERARADAACSPRTTFLHGDLFTHPLEPGSFDLVAASAMLHHVDARAGLRRMAELVRPGGTVAIVGFANPSGLADWAHIAAGFLLTRVRGALGHCWEHHAPVRWPPPLTMNEMRALTEAEMPGATFRRAMAHRYTIVWSRPAS
ncbi:MAG TPA: class I SAM-dependent methyltransferase [Acidimicrobiales bacterium]|nr:class I SAM-dependent methyltransferase [Acidimicrobiales bacterium]